MKRPGEGLFVTRLYGAADVVSPSPDSSPLTLLLFPPPFLPQLASVQGNPNTITEDEFRGALAACGIIESDHVILHQLFGVMDKTSDGQVNFKDFITCASVMIAGSIKEKLNFTFQMYCSGSEDGKKGEVSAEQMKNILNHLNTTASWFGDPSLGPEEVDKLVGEVYEKHDAEKSGTLSYAEYMHAVAENPIIVQFVSGQGTVKPTKATLVLPVWWAEVTLSFAGRVEGGVFLKCQEFTDMVMATKVRAVDEERRTVVCIAISLTTLPALALLAPFLSSQSNRACKSSVVREKLGESGIMTLLQEWHGPIEDKLYTESEFKKKVDGTEGVDMKLERWKSVDL